MTNPKTPMPGGVTEEQIDAAARATYHDQTARYGDKITAGIGQPCWRHMARAALSVSASAHPTDEHHDAEEREAEFDRPCERDHVGICRNCGKGIDARHDANGIYEPCSSPLTLPGKPTERPAESEDHGATVTGEVNALIDSLDEHVTHEDIAPALAEFRDGPITAALAAPVEVDEAKLAEAKFSVESVHQIHGTDCLCGFSSHRSRSRTERITEALATILRGEGR